MARFSANYHDDPRLETETGEIAPRPMEADRRAMRLGTDTIRIAMGQAEQYSPESKVQFQSPEAQRLANLIKNSDLSDSRIKERIRLMIDAAAQRGVITADEADGLKHYLDHAEGFSDDLGREPDFRERQAG